MKTDFKEFENKSGYNSYKVIQEIKKSKSNYF